MNFVTGWIVRFQLRLKSAVRRGHEGLLPYKTIRAFNEIYFPAQRVHLELDNPHGTADHVIENDPRLARSQPAIIKDRRLLEAPGCKFGFDPCPRQA